MLVGLQAIHVFHEFLSELARMPKKFTEYPMNLVIFIKNAKQSSIILTEIPNESVEIPDRFLQNPDRIWGESMRIFQESRRIQERKSFCPDWSDLYLIL